MQKQSLRFNNHPPENFRPLLRATNNCRVLELNTFPAETNLIGVARVVEVVEEHERFRGEYGRVVSFVGVLVHPVQVAAQVVGPVVAPGHAVRIQHRDQLEHVSGLNKQNVGL